MADSMMLNVLLRAGVNSQYQEYGDDGLILGKSTIGSENNMSGNYQALLQISTDKECLQVSLSSMDNSTSSQVSVSLNVNLDRQNKPAQFSRAIKKHFIDDYA